MWRAGGNVWYSCMVMYGHGAKVANTEENRKEKEKDKEWEIEKDGQDNCSREGKGCRDTS